MRETLFSRRLAALLLAFVMVLGLMPTALAAEDAEDEANAKDDAGSETSYAISIYNGKQPNQNGTLSYTITSQDGTVSQTYTLDSETQGRALAGDTITLYPKANDGYVLGSIGYVKEARVENSFTVKSTTEQSNGSYTFTMPSYDIYVGAAFYAEDDYYVLKETGTSNSVANVDPLHVINLGLNHAWLHQNAEEVSVDMYLDTRILGFEEQAGKTLTFRMEIREVGDSGYTLVGSKEYTTEELKALVQDAKTETDSKARTYYVLRDVKIPVDADKDFTVDKEVYCTAMYTLEGWTNAIGAVNYRWNYSGGDRAYILENDTPIPTSMVYLYNLDPETFHGALVAEAIDQVEEEMGITIETRYFNADNMTECIGYLAEWPGYDSFGELGVDRQPSEKTYKRKIVLYCSLPSMVREKLGDYIRDTGANVLSNKLTAYGAAKSFEAFYATQETEATVFTAALGLSLLTYEAYNNVPESEYGTHELWPEFKAAYDECKAIVNSAKEQEESVYTNARLKLLDVYLRILGKEKLNVDFTFLIEAYDEDNYKITVDTSSFPEDLEVEYYWYDASKLDYLIIPKTQLYKVTCSISATDDCPYYGFQSISLSVPAALKHQVTHGSTSISVAFTRYETKANTPEPITYVAELYQNGEKLQTLSNDTGDTLTFMGLSPRTEYTVQVYATNIVGRTDYAKTTLTTDKRTSGGSSSSSKPVTKPETPEQPPEETPEETPSTTVTFQDVSGSDWFAADVAYVVEQGLMKGTSETKFSPNDTTTRAMLMTILARLSGADTAGGEPWYALGMAWAKENGISDGTDPDGAITREQLATMLWRYAGSPAAAGSLDGFADGSQANDYAATALAWAVEKGILNGMSADTLAPQGTATRAQVAAMLHRFCELMGQ